MRARASLLAAAGIILIAFGLLFLVGAGGQMRRVAVGFIGLTAGALTTGFGIRNYKRAELWSPEQLRADILDLAQRKNGEIAMSDIEAELGHRVRVVGPVLEKMALEGLSRKTHQGGSDYFVFKHLQPRLMVRFCRYCDAEFPISEERDDCPNCGGALHTQVARRSISEGEVFSMHQADDPIG
ncbi:MAG: hypothetical protein DRJ65_13460 [Acidobacteria bacterium]|nr:MAG: hypothetical protein DRJ65_13460 [Acidobacteriota bacterium]